MRSCLLLLTVLFSGFVNSEENYPLLDNLTGKWEGRWDNKFGVKFEISKSDKTFYVKYFVEETIGEPYEELKFEGVPVNKNSVMAGTLLFIVSLEVKNELTVVGMFKPGTRITKLKRR